MVDQPETLLTYDLRDKSSLQKLKENQEKVLEAQDLTSQVQDLFKDFKSRKDSGIFQEYAHIKNKRLELEAQEIVLKLSLAYRSYNQNLETLKLENVKGSHDKLASISQSAAESLANIESNYGILEQMGAMQIVAEPLLNRIVTAHKKFVEAKVKDSSEEAFAFRAFLEKHKLPLKQKKDLTTLSESSLSLISPVLKNFHRVFQLKEKLSEILGGSKETESPQQKKRVAMSITATLTSLYDTATMIRSTPSAEEKPKEVAAVNFASCFLEGLVKSIGFLFLKPNDLNLVEKPEWMFNYLFEALEVNLTFLRKLPGLPQTILQSFLENYIIMCKTLIERRVKADYEYLSQGAPLFIHFTTELINLENKIIALLQDQELQTAELPNFFESLFIAKSERKKKLFETEWQNFKAAIFAELGEYELSSENFEGAKKFHHSFTAIIQNFTEMYKIGIKKYENVTEEANIRYFKDELWVKILDKLIDNLGTFVDSAQNLKNHKKKFYIFESCLSIHHFLRSFFERQERKGELLFEMTEEFSTLDEYLGQIEEGFEKGVQKLEEPVLKKIKSHFNSKAVLNRLSSKDEKSKTTSEDEGLLALVKELENNLKDIVSVLHQDTRKKILEMACANITDYLFAMLLPKMKFSEFGLAYTIETFTSLLKLVQSSSSEIYEQQVMRLKEVSDVLRRNKKGIVEVLEKLPKDVNLKETKREASVAERDALKAINVNYLNAAELYVVINTHMIE